MIPFCDSNNSFFARILAIDKAETAEFSTLGLKFSLLLFMNSEFESIDILMLSETSFEISTFSSENEVTLSIVKLSCFLIETSAIE